MGGFSEGVEVITDIEQASGHDIAILVTAHKACIDLDWSGLSVNEKLGDSRW